MGAEHRDMAQFAYDRLGNVLRLAGLKENDKKAVPPTQIIEFLGVTFNAAKGTMEVSPH